MASDDLIEFAVQKGWWIQEKEGEFNFEKAYAAETPQEKARNYRAGIRQKCSLGLLEEKQGEVTLRWMMRIARDRSSNPSIDLDQTASSCVAMLPNQPTEIPVFWWCASTPSSSCYVPFFVHGSRLPEMVSTAGTAGKTIMPPSKAQPDSFSEKSYWWIFKDLRDKTNIDWAQRNPVVREAFDALEKEFASGIPEIMSQAVGLRKEGKIDEASGVLDGYTAACVEKALDKANELRSKFEEAGVPERFEPYLGTYMANFGAYRDAEFEVGVLNNCLAVNIPGQGFVELKDPDAEGKWYFKVSNMVAVSFVATSEGEITALRFQETAPFPKKKINPGDADTQDIPDEYKDIIGLYSVPSQNIDLIVLVEEGQLALDIPGQGVVDLEGPDEQGRWVFKPDPSRSLSFYKNRKGEVMAMHFHSLFTLPKKKEIQ